MKKRGSIVLIILGLILLLNISFALADAEEKINLTLTKKDYGPEQNFEGNIVFNITEPIYSDASVVFNINSDTGETNFKDLMSRIGKNKTIKTNIILDYEDQENIEVSTPSNQTIGIDFTSASSISSLQFHVENLTADIDQFQIDLGGDGKIDWTYRGEPLPGSFPENISASKGAIFYTKGINEFSGDSTTDMILDPAEGKGVTYCEKVTIDPSNEYYIRARLKANTQQPNVHGALILGDIASANVLSYANDCSTNGIPNDANVYCCNFTNVGYNTLNTSSCLINKSNDVTRFAFACVFAENDNNKYSIAKEPDGQTEITNAYYRGGYVGEKAPKASDYLISIYNHKFSTKLKHGADVVIDVDAMNISKTFKNKAMIINFLSQTPGKVKLSNLVAEIPDDTVIYFKKVTTDPEKINVTGVVTIPLIKISDLLTPDNTGNDQTLSMSIGDFWISNTEKFNVLAGPEIKIEMGNSIRSAGEIITFNANKTVPRLDSKNATIAIKTYSWNFGDNTTANGSFVTHTYNKEGDYRVVINVVDAGGIGSSSFVNVKIIALSGSIIELINQSLITVTDSKNNIELGNIVIRDTALLLGIDKTFTTVQDILTDLIEEATAIDKNTTLNDTQKNSKFTAIKTKYDGVMKDIPISINITDILNFDATVVGLSNVPDAKGLGIDKDIDQFKEKLLQAQKDLKVNGEARNVVLQMTSSAKDSKILIKKTITGGKGDIYEVYPSSFEKGEILKGDCEFLKSGNGLKCGEGTNQIVYTLKGNIKNAGEIWTLTYPSDLESITIENPDDGGSSSGGGNDVVPIKLEVPEESGVERPWTLIIIVLVVGLGIAGGVFFLMTKYGNKKPIPSARMLFKNENDYNAVKKYVEESLHQKGFTEQQISLVLKKKGWTDQQINGVIAEVKNAKPGAKPGLGIAKPGFINPGKPSLPQKPQEVHKL